MAQWYKFKVVFVEPPSDTALGELNADLKDKDYDAPKITKDGFEESWRSPLVSEEELRELFVKCGIECKFQFWEDTRIWEDSYPVVNWCYSSKLAEAKEKVLALSKSEKEDLLGWLDGP